jgi:hypothetical protein
MIFLKAKFLLLALTSFIATSGQDEDAVCLLPSSERSEILQNRTQHCSDSELFSNWLRVMHVMKMLSQMAKSRKSLSEADGFLHYPYYLWSLTTRMFRTHHMLCITLRNTKEMCRYTSKMSFRV